MMVSADGFIAGPNGELDWLMIDDDFNTFVKSMLEGIDGILLGRGTYEELAEYWPTSTAPEATLMNELPKYVVSTALHDPDWANTTVLANVQLVRELKSRPGRDLALFASAHLAGSLAGLDLIDEYRVITFPIFIGGGSPFFAGLHRSIPLTLTNRETFGSGAIFSTYEPRVEERG